MRLFEDPDLLVFDVAADGRFLALKRAELPPPPDSLVLVTNWLAALERRVTTGR